MCKYFIDTEFLEGTQSKTFCGIKVGETKPTIDLISIGIVSEDGREYYAISKDFKLKEAWNRYQIEHYSGDMRNKYPNGYKVYWLRENVLKPIYEELMKFLWRDYKKDDLYFNYNDFKNLINKYGKTNQQIAEEIQVFIANRGDSKTEQWLLEYEFNKNKPEFYAYYADYDWVAFCWLFGKMIDLPKGFPMYCKDLKQIYDKKQLEYKGEIVTIGGITERHMPTYIPPTEYKITELKKAPGYPKQTNEHNALADARWNKELYNFLNKL